MISGFFSLILLIIAKLEAVCSNVVVQPTMFISFSIILLTTKSAHLTAAFSRFLKSELVIFKLLLLERIFKKPLMKTYNFGCYPEI